MERMSIEIDKYGNLTLPTPSLMDDGKSSSWDTLASDVCSSSKSYQKWPKPTLMMNDLFFADNCQKNEDGTRSLILNGDDLQSTIGRRLKNWDVPYLVLFLVNNTDVIRLNLANNQIDSAGFMGLIRHLTVYNHVRELDMRNNEIGDPGINNMYRNRKKLQLQVLRLNGNKFGIQNSKKVALTIANNQFIQHLDIAETDQNEESLIYFATVLRTDLNFSNKLKILDLSRPNPKCAYLKLDSQHIAETFGITLRYNTTLEELHLQKFNFSCHDVEDMLRSACYNRTIKVLDLRCNNIGDYGVEILSKWLKNCSPLRSLLLGNNIISNIGIRILGEAVLFSEVTRLDVSYNRLDDHGCAELLHWISKVPLIKQIQIYGNDIGSLTAEMIEKLFELNVFEQKDIDVKLYKVDEIPYLAYYEFGRQT